VHTKSVHSVVVGGARDAMALIDNAPAEVAAPAFPTRITIEDPAEAERIIQEKAAQARNAQAPQPAPAAPAVDAALPPQQAPAAGGEESQTQPDEIELWNVFVEQCSDAAQANGMDAKAFSSAWGKAMLAARVKGKEHTYPQDKRASLYEAVVKGQGYFAATK
jgi:hypothetical protein